MTTPPPEGGKPKTRSIIGDRYVSYRHRHQTDGDYEGIEAIGRIALFVAFLAIVFYLTRTLPRLFTILDRNISNKFILASIGAIGSFMVGLGLYYFRERKRMYYSLLEIALGIVTGAIGILRVNTQGNLSVWLALSASAYLVVRGLDNLHTAREQEVQTKSFADVEVSPAPLSE